MKISDYITSFKIIYHLHGVYLIILNPKKIKYSNDDVTKWLSVGDDPYYYYKIIHLSKKSNYALI